MIFDTSFVVKSASLASSTTKGGDDGEGGKSLGERDRVRKKKGALPVSPFFLDSSSSLSFFCFFEFSASSSSVLLYYKKRDNPTVSSQEKE